MPPKRPATATPAKPPVDDQILSQKDSTLFKQISRFYEQKQHKKAIRSADAILKSHPNHGETLAMKGLVLHQLKKKDEAYALVKKGLAANIKSHVCWHVYGLIYRSDNKYEDAIKCYTQANKRDPNGQQILKDLSTLQIQRRMLDGFTESRRKLLQLKSNNKHNWVAYAIGNHLTKNYTKALAILEALDKTEDMGQRAANDKRPPTYEESEMHLYRAMLLEEAGKPAESLKYITEKQHEIVDKIYAIEKKGQLYLALGQLAESEAEYRKLLEINPENYAYHIGFQKAKGFIAADHPATKSFLNVTYTQQQSDQLLQLYETDALFTTKAMSKVAALKRIPLGFTTGATFKKLVSTYLKDKISRGIPSLFSDLEPLYQDPAKSTVIGELLDEYLTNLRAENKFEKSDAKDSESPSSLMYALYYGAQHYDHLNQTDRALALVNESIAHTPTSPDSYMLKARIYKHAGDPITGYGWMDTARRLDTQDRYLNTKCVRYAIRADQLQAAEDTVSLFLRDGDGLAALSDLQVCWYENNAAEAHIRAKQYGKALKKLTSIDKHFADMYEDQYEFHSYCLRKSTLRAYIDMIRWADQLRSHRFHVRAAVNIIKLYLRLFDQPQEEAHELESLAVEQNLSPEEKKEEAKRLKKAQAKAKQAEEKKAAAEAAAKAAANKGKPVKDVDPDPEGLELLKADPLVEATRHLQNLTCQYGSSLQTHTLAVQVYLRKAKYLLALKYLKRAMALDRTHPDTHFAICTFLHAIRKEGVLEKLNPLVQEAIEKEISVFGSASVSDLNNSYLNAASSQLPQRLSAARVLFVLDPVGNKAAAVTLASKLDEKESFTRAQATESLQYLQDVFKASNEIISGFQATALKKFPYAVVFGAKPNPPKPIDATD